MVTCTTPPFRAAVRLNSGVMRGQTQEHVFLVVSVSCVPIVLLLLGDLVFGSWQGVPHRPPSWPSLSEARIPIFAGLRSLQPPCFAYFLALHNVALKPRPLRGLVQVALIFHLPKAANRSGLAQALGGYGIF